MLDTTGSKALPGDRASALERVSVVDRPTIGEAQVPSTPDGGVIYIAAQAASDIVRWGLHPPMRDAQLRAFLGTEPVLHSAIGSVVARNVGFRWSLDGPERMVRVASDILKNANAGLGWADFIAKLSWDVYTQDKGAFAELLRSAPSAGAPVIGLQTLDAARCTVTGNAEFPVIYQDRKGRYHQMPHWSVLHFTELPANHETLYGLQYCAITRVLRAAQIYRNIQIYTEEKTGGRHNRAIQIVSGVSKGELQAALDATQGNADNRGQLRYIQPVVVPTLKPDAKPEVATVELSGLPDGFDAEEAFRQYITVLAMGLLTDFQDLAPLPGGGLGTSMQSQILHLKSRGKGAAVFQDMVEQRLNFGGVLPRSVTFTYSEDDVDEDRANADVQKVLAESWKALIETGVLDAQAARQLALDAGIIPQEVFDRLDMTGQGDATMQDGDTGADTVGEQPDVLQNDEKSGRSWRGWKAPSTERAGGAPVERARLAFEGEFQEALEGAFAEARQAIQDELEREEATKAVALPRLTVVEKTLQRDPQGRILGVIERHAEGGAIEKIVRRDDSGRIVGVVERHEEAAG